LIEKVFGNVSCLGGLYCGMAQANSLGNLRNKQKQAQYAQQGQKGLNTKSRNPTYHFRN